MTTLISQDIPAETDDELLVVEDEDLEDPTLTDTQLDSVSESSFSCHWQDCSFVGTCLADLPEHITQEHIKKCTVYACQWESCERKDVPLATRFALVSHVRKHTGEKPFVCLALDCQKTFSRSDALSKHIRTFHPEKVERQRAMNASQQHHPEDSLLTSPRKRQKSIKRASQRESAKRPTYTGPYRNVFDLLVDDSKDSSYKYSCLCSYGCYLWKEHVVLEGMAEKLAAEHSRLQFEKELLQRNLNPTDTGH